MPFSREAAVAKSENRIVATDPGQESCPTMHANTQRSHWDGIVTEWCRDCSAGVSYEVEQ